MQNQGRVRDATGFSLALEQWGSFRRIVSLVPSQTEFLLAIGASVVGRTRYCHAPAEAVEEIPIVGGTKDFDLDAIRACQPDLVLANLEENVAEPLLKLRQEIPVWTTQVRSLSEALKMFQNVGQLCAREQAAQGVIEQVQEAFLQLKPDPAAPRVLYLIWRKPWMSVGQDSFIHNLIGRCGWVNVCGQHTRYPSLSIEEIKQAQADLILLSSEPYPFQDKHREELQTQLNLPCLFVDGAAFSWYGSRLIQTPTYLQSCIEEIKKLQSS